MITKNSEFEKEISTSELLGQKKIEAFDLQQTILGKEVAFSTMINPFRQRYEQLMNEISQLEQAKKVEAAKLESKKFEDSHPESKAAAK